MWLGDISIGDTPTPDPNAAPTPAASSASSDITPYVNLAANLAQAFSPKTGVPVTVGISSQTQSFLMMGGIFLGGLLLLNMMKR
jgi:hypothetical protein